MNCEGRAKRRILNRKALNSNDPAWVYQNFSGNGGLHEVEFKDYGNFHDYTLAKQEFELGQFFTPPSVARLIVELLEIEPEKKVADLTCGSGQFFNFLKGRVCTGVEAEDNAATIAQKLYSDARVKHTDLRFMTDIDQQDYMVGNPPLNLVWEDTAHPLRSSRNNVLSQDVYVFKSHQYLKPGGFLCFICPAIWLTDELRHGKVRTFLEEHFVPFFEIALPADTFKAYGVANFATKVLCYQKRIPGTDLSYPTLTLAFGPSDKALNSWRKSPSYRLFPKNKGCAHQYQLKFKYTDYFSLGVKKNQERLEEDTYRKLLYELGRVRPDKVSGILAARQRVDTAEKPAEMEWEQWERQKPTLAKLNARIRKLLVLKPEKHQVRLVKGRSAIRLQADSRKAKLALSSAGLPTEWSLHKLINREFWTQEWRSFRETIARLYDEPLFYVTKKERMAIAFQNFSAGSFLARKQKEFQGLRSDLSTVQPDPATMAQLRSSRFGDKKLLPHQVEDVAKALTKASALLNWEMGTGKTLAAIAWSKLKGGNTLVVAPSILIRQTWKDELASSGEHEVRIIERFADLEVAREARFVLISLERLPRYAKRLKKLRFRNLILDESDNIKNKASARAKALRSVARPIVHKLILAGTFTRNNAVEAYNQLELLLNNTNAMLCEVPKIKEYDPREKEYVEKPNPIYQLPYPARGGIQVFRKNFSPKKSTVFGASQTNQELYNKGALDRLLRTVRLRRRFEDVKPEEVTYDLQQITVPMTNGEVKVYEFIFEEFAHQVEKYYAQDHDGRVARMLVLMRQIMALLQGVSHPWTFGPYDGPEITSKMAKVIEIIRSNPGKKIMFGSPWKPTAAKYAEVLSREFKVIALESDLSIGKRNQLIREFREGEAQVLVSTIGVLKAGVNIPEAEIVITDSYPWNFAQLSQYFFRAIRLNARNHTQVYCLSNEGSFDSNVFNLLIAKERINRFVQDGEDAQITDIAADFGVNEDMLESAIELTKEKVNGRSRATVTWGESVLTNELARSEC